MIPEDLPTKVLPIRLPFPGMRLHHANDRPFGEPGQVARSNVGFVC